MNIAYTILLSILLSSELIEPKPRYGYSFWGKFVRSSELSSEEDSSESCVHCSYKNIGNGYGNRNMIYKNSHPDYNDYQGQTEINHGIEQNKNEGPQVPGKGYRMTSKPTYNGFGGNKSQRGDESYNNQRPFRPNVKQINELRRTYNDYETNNNLKRSNEIGDFGNGHHNTNTFNIHKKNIYIS